MKESTVPVHQNEHKEQSNVPQATREESRMLTPPVDIFEIEDGLAVVVDLPGVDKEHVEINVDNNVLTIKGTLQYEEHGEALYSEFELRSFYRQFELSDEIDQEKIRADMKNGVLTIRLPKAEKAKPRRIKVDLEGMGADQKTDRGTGSSQESQQSSMETSGAGRQQQGAHHKS